MRGGGARAGGSRAGGGEGASVRDSFGAPAAHFPEWEREPSAPVRRDSPGDWEYGP